MAEQREFTAVDWALFGLVALPELFDMVFPFLIAPVYAKMFADFGSAALPWVTRLALTKWFPFVVGMPAFLPLALALDARRALGERRVLLLVGLIVALAGAGLLVFAMYSPIFELAAAVK
ncbi:MAG: hypothetical protein QM723_04095 [Myxococcaceae bacterium]